MLNKCTKKVDDSLSYQVALVKVVLLLFLVSNMETVLPYPVQTGALVLELF